MRYTWRRCRPSVRLPESQRPNHDTARPLDRTKAHCFPPTAPAVAFDQLNGPLPQPTALIVIILLTILVGMGAISTDIYLPSLPSIAAEFSTDTASVQLTLSIFLIAFAVSQLVYGPISDQFGRRPALLGGMTLYFFACIGCVLATSIEALIVARFLQALGACSGPVVARAIVRDVFGRERSAEVLAYMGTAMALAPVLGPIAGGFLQIWFGWQASFAVMAALGGLSVAGVLFLLRETNVNRVDGAAKPSRVLRNYGGLARDRRYLGYVLCSAFAFCGLFSFISASSFVFIGLIGLAPNIYGLCFAAVACGYMAGTFLAGRLTTRLGIDPLVRIGTAVIMAAGALMIALVFAGYFSVPSILVPMIIYMFGFGLLHPNAMAGAIGPHASRAGAASALLGFVQLGLAAFVGVAVGHTLGDKAMPMILAIFLSGVAAFTAYSLLVRPAMQRQTVDGTATSEIQDGH